MVSSDQQVVPEASRNSSEVRGLSLGKRLALGFGLIALLVFIANYQSQRNATSVAERVSRSMETSNQLARVAQDLTDALASYQRAILSIGVAPSKLLLLKSQRMAEDSLLQATKTYAAIGNSSAPNLSPQMLAESVQALQENARELIADAKHVDDPLNVYWVNFDRLLQKLGVLESAGWRIGDRVFTRRSTMSIVDALLDVRRGVSAYLASPNAHRAATVALQEREFIAVLNRNADSLVELQGEKWVNGVRADFERLRGGLRNVKTMRGRIERRVATVSAGIQDLTNAVRIGIGEPAEKMLAASSVEAGQIAQQATSQMKMASVAILALIVAIAFFTVASVTGPIARLRGATLKLAAGNESVRAARGGTRELDQLAVAFNNMADRLAKAQLEMRNQHARLEERVAERTQQLQHLAHHDTLTQLPNRRLLFQHLTIMLDLARGADQRMALLLLDLDNFKTLNDSLGHLFGDRVLQAVSERLVAAIGPNGFVARLGGDEFTIVCDLSVDVAQQADALLEKFQRPLQVDDRELIVNLSIGAGIFPDHGEDAESLLRAADAALFKAKELGRNRACVASKALVDWIGGQFKTEQALRRATTCNELLLLFQPQLNLSQERVHVVEALVRWKRGDVYVSPLDFLPLAAQSGLIAEITDWVLKSAIGTLAEWRRGSWPQARVAVNISAQQFVDPAFIRKLQSMLLLHEVPPSSLELELTETALQSGNGTIDTLRELRDLGVGIALDDFGAGYSSLASLELLSLSRVKIDRSLIANIDQDPRSTSIAHSIIDLCRSLNLEVTVEGVERREQFHILRHCESVDLQGYLFARPVPVDAVLGVCAALPTRLQQLIAADVAATRSQRPTSGSILRWRGPPRTR